MRTSLLRYVGALVLSHVVAVVDASAVMTPLRMQANSVAQSFYVGRNLTILLTLAVAAIVVIAVGGVVILKPTLTWFIAGETPNENQRQAAFRLGSIQSIILATPWAVGGIIFFLMNFGTKFALAVPTFFVVLVVGAAASVSTGLLFVQRQLRPILAEAARGAQGGFATTGVFSRLIAVWFSCSVLPISVIAALVLMRTYGWVIQRSDSVVSPVLTVAFVTVLLGIPAMIATARSISDPVGEVVDAMAEVEHGLISTSVGIYERSQLGRLQRGFNRMVTGLAERDRLRDLFGRHVGKHVAVHALNEGVSLSGEVREVAVLFIDLVGSTQLAASRPPQKVAEVLNDFFRIVVDTVDQHNGLINKFAGDAALAVFGAPLRADNAASAALATARALRTRLRSLAAVDFGVGVSAGRAFAGNIGAENRYEYTVIGDSVNEAARLADMAKKCDERILCSAAAIERADETERNQWTASFSTVLRGRSEPTQVSVPKRWSAPTAVLSATSLRRA